ncbi:MAG: hypothetical protein HOE45_08195 [Gammaproteobacteria bacterium]|jgi:acyl carrier protein|nr:hypothetical protein [Gammaproteobacteria bacterium]
MRNENLTILRKIVRAVLEISDDQVVDTVRQMNNRKWDSLAQLTMVATAEAEFEINIATQEYERFTSFESITILLEEKGL